MRSYGREDVAPMKSRANWMQKIFFVLQRANRFDFLLPEGPGKNAIVRPHEKIVGRLHRNGFAVAANAGIDDCNMDRALRKKSAACGQRKCAGADVTWRDVMGDVDD